MNVKLTGLAFVQLFLSAVAVYGQNTGTEAADVPDEIAEANLQSVNPEIGESLFKTYCTACHHMEMRLVGPALKDVHTRRAEDWIINFVQRSQDMIASGDTTAVAMFNEFNRIIMPDQPVDEGQIKNILAYIKSYGSEPSEKGNITRPRLAATSGAIPLKFSDFRFWITYTIMVILMVITLFYLIEYNSITDKRE